VGQVVVFSDGSGYVVFGRLGFSVYSIDGKFLYSGGLPAYVGSTCIVFYSGGVSVVDFRGFTKAFYPLNFTPTVLAGECRAVVAANQTLGVYISPERIFSFSLPAPPYAAVFLNGVGYIQDVNGDVLVVGPRGVVRIAVGGHPAGLAASVDCVVASVVRGGVQYFYRVDGGSAILLGSRLARVGLAYSYAVGPGCRLEVAAGNKTTAVAVDGPYTIYGTSTGLVEVYLGGQLVYSRNVGEAVLSLSSVGLNVVYETASGARPLVLRNVTVVSNCGVWSVLLERGERYSLPRVVDLGGGARCVYVSNVTEGGVIRAAYERQYYVELISPRPLSGWFAEGYVIPPPEPAQIGYVVLRPAGWLVGGKIVERLVVAGPLRAQAVYRVEPVARGDLGNGTYLDVVVETAEVVWPQQPLYKAQRLYYVEVSGHARAERGSGFYPEGSVVEIIAEEPQAPEGCRYVFSGWTGINATGPKAVVKVRGPVKASPRFIMECKVSLYTKYGVVQNAPEWAPVGSVIEPTVTPTAVWDPFPLLYEFAGWEVGGRVVRTVAVAGPVVAVAKWSLNPMPLVALVAAAGLAAFYIWKQRRRLGIKTFKYGGVLKKAPPGEKQPSIEEGKGSSTSGLAV
jgi:hypothetical protein